MAPTQMKIVYAALAMVLLPGLAVAADLPNPDVDRPIRSGDLPIPEAELPPPSPMVPWREDVQSDWQVSIGAFSFIGPEYEGSNDYDVGGFPIIDIRWRDNVFLNVQDGLGVDLFKNRKFTLSTSIGIAGGRDEDVSDDLNGLGDIDAGAAAIVKGEFRHKGFALSSRYSRQISGEDTGYLVDFGLGYTIKSQSGWILKPGLSASYASGEYMDKFFGINAAQAAASGLDATDVDAGFKSVGTGLSAGYPLDRHWTFLSRASYKRMVGDAADSPVTKDKDQFTFGIGISHKF